MLEGPEKALMFAEALATGGLDRSSSSGALQGKLGVPQTRLRPYRDALLAAPETTDLVLALRVSAETAARSVAAQPLIEVAWTYPGPSRPGLRTTGGVAREIIDDSKSTLLVVGYTVTVDPRLSGLAAQTSTAIASAAERGVVVTAVLHRDANRRALLQAWKGGAPEPSVFTWPVADDDKASIHAKLLIADRRDGLVTSANLTYHGFEGTIEMGLRVTGKAAAEIHDRIHELIAARELVPWRD
jgi:phosphatidylserine/phosphatidylglycerophosphate/cardiolipin synthase-like enzyme